MPPSVARRQHSDNEIMTRKEKFISGIKLNVYGIDSFRKNSLWNSVYGTKRLVRGLGFSPGSLHILLDSLHQALCLCLERLGLMLGQLPALLCRLDVFQVVGEDSGGGFDCAPGAGLAVKGIV
jgi:hypothetical protein